jgi:hypothetical protein
VSQLVAATSVQYSVRNKSEFPRLLKHHLPAKPFAGVTYAVAGSPDFITWGTVIVPILAIIGAARYPTTNLDHDPDGTAVDAAVYAIIRRHRPKVRYVLVRDKSKFFCLLKRRLRTEPFTGIEDTIARFPYFIWHYVGLTIRTAIQQPRRVAEQ